MQIRVAQVEDIETLFEIRTSVRENRQSRVELAQLGVTPRSIAHLLQTHSRAWIAETGDRAIGFALANAAEKTVFALFVLPEFEGRGTGRSLLQQAETWLWSHPNIEEIWLSTTNNPALRAYGFYRHLGWIATEASQKRIKFVKRKNRFTEQARQ
ncbi:MAG: GNAT family N-acetyltransferase [Microcoleus sp. SIO2G3]|nr:GNAT family N-acetyltransferase [Microcoleus sp. SIO2G3]